MAKKTQPPTTPLWHCPLCWMPNGMSDKYCVGCARERGK